MTLGTTSTGRSGNSHHLLQATRATSLLTIAYTPTRTRANTLGRTSNLMGASSSYTLRTIRSSSDFAPEED